MFAFYPEEYKRNHSINAGGINCTLYQSTPNLLECQEKSLHGCARQPEMEQEDEIKGNWAPLLS